jgi:hypothetical protein
MVLATLSPDRHARRVPTWFGSFDTSYGSRLNVAEEDSKHEWRRIGTNEIYRFLNGTATDTD